MKKLFTGLLITLPLVSSLDGCAMWPGLDPESSLDPTSSQIPVCQSLKAVQKDALGNALADPHNPGKFLEYDPYFLAKGCAYVTINELSKMLEDTGDFDRAVSYAALGIGTGVGAVLGFNGSADTLKGLGIVSGSLLGLTSIVKTDAQRAVLGKALKDVSCLVRSADVVNNVAPPLQTQFATPLSFQIVPNGVNLTGSTVQDPQIISAASILATDYSTSDNSLASYTKAVNAKKSSIPWDLASAIIDIRMDVRQKLNSLSNSQSILSEQQDRVTNILGELMAKKKKKDEAKNSLILTTSKLGNILGTNYGLFVDITPPSVDEFDEKLDQVFKDCASEAGKSGLGK